MALNETSRQILGNGEIARQDFGEVARHIVQRSASAQGH